MIMNNESPTYKDRIVYLQKEFWFNYLGSLFETVYPSNWGDDSSFFSKVTSLIPQYHWFRKGPYVIGIKIVEMKRPDFIFVYLTPKNETRCHVKFDFRKAEEFKCVIQAFANPQELYICMGIDWITPILETALINA